MIFADGAELTLASFRKLEHQAETVTPPPSVNAAVTIRETVDNVEHALIREALERHHGNKKRVAEELGISRSHLYKKLAVIGQR